jgi:hypothetical protein
LFRLAKFFLDALIVAMAIFVELANLADFEKNKTVFSVLTNW